jgi:dCMP deaminase
LKKKFIDYFMSMAELTASLSYAKRLQVGALIVKGNRIVGTGYNGMPTDWDNVCEEVVPPNEWVEFEQLKTKPEVLHAEMNALMKLAKSSESGNNAAIFITHSPCIDCAKGIYQAGIKEVYYKNDYHSSQGIEFLEKCELKITKV